MKRLSQLLQSLRLSGSSGVLRSLKEYKNTIVVCAFVCAFVCAWGMYYCEIDRAIEHFSFPFLMKPHLSNLDVIYLKTSNGKYITSCSGCQQIGGNISNNCKKMLCVKDIPYLSSQFTYHKHRDGTFSFETTDGRYWKRCARCVPGCPDSICSDGINSNLQTHKFVLIKNRNGTVSIKSDNGRLLETTECNQTCGKIVTALGLNHSTEFTIDAIPKQISIHHKPIKLVDFSDKLPQEFPKQLSYGQH